MYLIAIKLDSKALDSVMNWEEITEQRNILPYTVGFLSVYGKPYWTSDLVYSMKKFKERQNIDYVQGT